MEERISRSDHPVLASDPAYSLGLIRNDRHDPREQAELRRDA
jgi:hypothetical protein